MVARDAIDQAVAATGLHEILKIENQELLRQNEELKTAAQAHCDYVKELKQIIQQTLDEYEGRKPQISKALYRRIEDKIPSILEELPLAINPFGGLTLRTRDPASVSSLDQVSGSTSSNHPSDCLKRESWVANRSNDAPSKRQCLYGATPSAVSFTGPTTLLTERPTPTPKGRSRRHAETPCFAATNNHTRSQQPYGPSFAQNMSSQPLSHESDFHQPRRARNPSTMSPTHPTPSLAHSPTHFRHENPPESHIRLTPPQLGNYGSATQTFGQQYNPADDFGFNAMGFPVDQDLCNMICLQGSNTWDNYDSASLLNAPPHSGDGFIDNIFGDSPTGG